MSRSYCETRSYCEIVGEEFHTSLAKQGEQKMRLKRLLAPLTALVGLATMTAFGRQSETALPHYLSVDVDVVLVNATVTDSHGHYVAKLGSDGFRLWEDRIEQKIEYVASEDIPQTVGIL